MHFRSGVKWIFVFLHLFHHITPKRIRCRRKPGEQNKREVIYNLKKQITLIVLENNIARLIKRHRNTKHTFGLPSPFLSFQEKFRTDRNKRDHASQVITFH